MEYQVPPFSMFFFRKGKGVTGKLDKERDLGDDWKERPRCGVSPKQDSFHHATLISLRSTIQDQMKWKGTSWIHELIECEFETNERTRERLVLQYNRRADETAPKTKTPKLKAQEESRREKKTPTVIYFKMWAKETPINPQSPNFW